MKKENHLYQKWESAVELNYAWFQHATDRQKTMYRNATGDGHGTAGRECEMQTNLQIDLAHGKLIALGFPVGQGADDGPIEIKRQYFQKGAQINWQEDAVVALGHKFQLIRVLFPKEHNTDEISAVPVSKSSTKTPIGRPSTRHLVRAVICELGTQPDFFSMPQKSRHERIKYEVRSRHPSKFLGRDSPEKKIINQLLREIYPKIFGEEKGE